MPFEHLFLSDKFIILVQNTELSSVGRGGMYINTITTVLK